MKIESIDTLPLISLLTFSVILSFSERFGSFFACSIVVAVNSQPVEFLFLSHARIATPLAVPT